MSFQTTRKAGAQMSRGLSLTGNCRTSYLAALQQLNKTSQSTTKFSNAIHKVDYTTYAQSILSMQHTNMVLKL